MRFGILSAATAMGLVAAPAFAADLGAPEPLPAPPIVEAAPVNNWTGFYLGALLGYTWGTANTDAVGDVDADGIDGGAYAGANYQWGNFVLGAEADLIIPGVEGDDGGIDVDQGLNGSLRARAGIALDRFLVYGTGGVALTDLELDDGLARRQSDAVGLDARRRHRGDRVEEHHGPRRVPLHRLSGRDVLAGRRRHRQRFFHAFRSRRCRREVLTHPALPNRMRKPGPHTRPLFGGRTISERLTVCGRATRHCLSAR